MPHFIFIQQISVLNILNMLYNLHFFFSSKCRLFHNATLFGFCITHILNTGCAKIWKKKSVARRLKSNEFSFIVDLLSSGILRSVQWQFHADVSGPEMYTYNLHRGGSLKSHLVSFNDTVSLLSLPCRGKTIFPFSEASHIGSRAHLATLLTYLLHGAESFLRS